MIRNVKTEDAAPLVAIYNHYIENTVITFEEMPLTEMEFAERITSITHDFPWIVHEQEQNVITGYAYANTWKTRGAYRQCVEISMYLDKNQLGKGIGTQLYQALIDALKARGKHTLLAGIAIPNDASIALHRKLGFEKVGYFKEVGRKFDRWLDVEYWELLINPQSPQ